ncbi:hypothetical protein NIES2119_07680 [[Phormidium ambiguum] IAM M-71]|uniref:Uncharacterized protein n=1 Tax=[Phormidium ambiguum] IAM M-71 TaxID=454136 RepID=A0A1U7INT2_9CYAN|nr:hypothetical protein NIES2119_07680 [Phormidium ambiguum IAM M-71]
MWAVMMTVARFNSVANLMATVFGTIAAVVLFVTFSVDVYNFLVYNLLEHHFLIQSVVRTMVPTTTTVTATASLSSTGVSHNAESNRKRQKSQQS